MADLPASPNSNRDETGVRRRSASPPSTPRWVKVFGIIVTVVVLLLIILHLTGYSPSAHASHPDHTERGAHRP